MYILRIVPFGNRKGEPVKFVEFSAYEDILLYIQKNASGLDKCWLRTFKAMD